MSAPENGRLARAPLGAGLAWIGLVAAASVCTPSGHASAPVSARDAGAPAVVIERITVDGWTVDLGPGVAEVPGRFGVRGFSPGRGEVTKDMPYRDLLKAIRTVHEGRRCLPQEIAAKMAERFGQEELSEREIDILKLIAAGSSNKLIDERLKVSENAVKHHVTAILEKLGAQDRTHAVTLALDRGVIHLDEVDLRDSDDERD